MRELIRAHAGLLLVGVATFVMMGAGQSLYGAALPVYSRAFGVTIGQAGTLVSAHWVGCFLGVGFMYRWGAGVRPRHALGLMAIGSAGLALMANWGLMLAAALVYGVGYGVATAVFNPRVLRAFGTRGASMLSLLNATFGVGAIAAPLVFVGLGSDPRWAFGLAALVCALVWLGAGAGAAGRVAAVANAAVHMFRPDWAILSFGLVAIGLEATLIGLGPTALIAAGIAEVQAAQLLSGFFTVFLLARVVLIFAAHRMDPFVLFTVAMAAAALCAVSAGMLSPGPMFVAMGAPVGLFFPGFYVTAARRMGEDIRVPPTIIAAGLVGGIFAPLAIAPMLTGLGGRGFFWLLAAVMVAMTGLALVSMRRAKDRGQPQDPRNIQGG